jgi:S-adenosylmethionine-diacylgycerolhomoserine-N-methlytransferase
MVVPPNAAVLEMGCGTARNLLKFRKLHPDAELYGLDASRSMLVTAEENLNSHGIKDRVTLRHCLAEELDHEKTFERSEGFDVIFFSYSLSMMPTWHAALDVALANLRPQGRVYIVDFWDQSGLPKFFAIVLRKWLAAFHVHFRPELLERLRQLQEQKVCTLELSGLGGNYAYIAELAKRQDLAL